jgi:hypothetical protein
MNAERLPLAHATGQSRRAQIFRLISGRICNFWGFYRNIRQLHLPVWLKEMTARQWRRSMPIAMAGVRDRISDLHRESNVNIDRHLDANTHRR